MHGCGEVVLGQSEIHISTSCVVGTMCGDNVLAFMQQGAVDECGLATYIPGISCGYHLLAVDIEFKGVVMLIGHIIVCRLVNLCQGHLSANPYIAAYIFPRGAYVAIIVIIASPCGFTY